MRKGGGGKGNAWLVCMSAFSSVPHKTQKQLNSNKISLTIKKSVSPPLFSYTHLLKEL